MRSWKHLRTILLLPGMVTLAIPGTILWLTGTDTLGLWRSFPASRVVLPILGVACVGLGLVLAISTIRLFVAVGEGTIAPWDPPQRLVVRGVYRHVRNPMITGLCLVLLGEAFLAASLPLLGLFALGVVINVIYIPLSEEPGLAKRFGDDYLTYRRNVPRWIPRLKPWQPDDLQGEDGQP
jgi:protein-S-isoprenylcysteine O-methyltransferase Ste14